MVYKAKKSYGGRSGGYGARSGYFRPSWDPMPAYRQPSAPESEYDRKVKSSVLRSELSGPSNFNDSSNSSYRIKEKRSDPGISDKDARELIDASLKDAIREFKSRLGVSELPVENYETMRETADALEKRFREIQNDPNDDTTVMDITQEFLEDKLSNSDIMERIEETRNQMDQVKKETLEIRDSLPEMEKFAENMKRYNDLYGNFGIPAETKTEYEIPEPQYDFNQGRKKRNELGYESEFDAM